MEVLLRRYLILFTVLVTVNLAGCDNLESNAPTEDTGAIPAYTNSSHTGHTTDEPVEIIEVPASGEAPEPSSMPVSVVTVPAYQGPIPEGAVARLGKGPVRETVLSPDGKHLAVSGDLGIYLYRTDTLEEMWFQPMPAGAMRYMPS
jgi:hypothetical protein